MTDEEILSRKWISNRTTAGCIAKTLYEQHGFEPDVAYLAAHLVLYGNFPLYGPLRAIANLQMTKRGVPVTASEAEFILSIYRKAKTRL